MQYLIAVLQIIRDYAGHEVPNKGMYMYGIFKVVKTYETSAMFDCCIAVSFRQSRTRVYQNKGMHGSSKLFKLIKLSFGTTFTLNILKYFRKQRIE